jgi:uncharacterized protein (TIGR00297 family)
MVPGSQLRSTGSCDTGRARVTSLFHSRGLPAAVVAIGFAVIARTLGAVTDGGALMGVLVAFVLMLAAGLAGFLPLITVFIITVLATRWGYGRKQQLGVAERGRGRSASQVLANLGATTLCVLPAIWFPRLSGVLLVGAMAALAEAAADTASSEIGQASARTAYMIIGFREAPIGANGAISVIGTLAGCLAACLVAWVSAVFDVVGWNSTHLIALAGIAGMFFDSLLGATWENSGKMGNDSVNFVSTVFAADLALTVAMVMQTVGK